MLRRFSLPLFAAILAGLGLMSVGPSPAFSQAPLFPPWLWNSPAQWAFSPDQLKLDYTLNGYRVWCWQQFQDPTLVFGVYTRADTTIGAMDFGKLRPLNDESCRALIRAYGRG